MSALRRSRFRQCDRQTGFLPPSDRNRRRLIGRVENMQRPVATRDFVEDRQAGEDQATTIPPRELAAVSPLPGCFAPFVFPAGTRWSARHRSPFLASCGLWKPCEDWRRQEPQPAGSGRSPELPHYGLFLVITGRAFPAGRADKTATNRVVPAKLSGSRGSVEITLACVSILALPARASGGSGSRLNARLVP